LRSKLTGWIVAIQVDEVDRCNPSGPGGSLQSKEHWITLFQLILTAVYCLDLALPHRVLPNWAAWEQYLASLYKGTWYTLVFTPSPISKRFHGTQGACRRPPPHVAVGIMEHVVEIPGLSASHCRDWARLVMKSSEKGEGVMGGELMTCRLTFFSAAPCRHHFSCHFLHFILFNFFYSIFFFGESLRGVRPCAFSFF
jgi:hypothetical protein